MKNRKKKQARQRQHFRRFTSGAGQTEPSVSELFPNRNPEVLKKLSVYELEQVWAEAVHRFKQEGVDISHIRTPKGVHEAAAGNLYLEAIALMMEDLLEVYIDKVAECRQN